MGFALSKKQMELLDMSIVASVATVSSKNIPYIKPVWVIMQDGKIYFTTKIDHKKYKNIIQNDNIALSVVHPEKSNFLSLHGKANIVERYDYDEFDHVLERIIRKYVENFDKANELINKAQSDDERVLIEIRPKEVY